jgi:hypothetical protein
MNLDVYEVGREMMWRLMRSDMAARSRTRVRETIHARMQDQLPSYAEIAMRGVNIKGRQERRQAHTSRGATRGRESILDLSVCMYVSKNANVYRQTDRCDMEKKKGKEIPVLISLITKTIQDRHRNLN